MNSLFFSLDFLADVASLRSIWHSDVASGERLLVLVLLLIVLVVNVASRAANQDQDAQDDDHDDPARQAAGGVIAAVVDGGGGEMLETSTSVVSTTGTVSTVKPAGMIVEVTAATVFSCVVTVDSRVLAADEVGEVIVTMMRTDAATISMEMRDASTPSSVAKLPMISSCTAAV